VEAPAPCKDALLAEIRRAKSAFYNTVVAQAQKVQEDADHVTFTFAPAQRTLREMFDEKRAWLEALALEVSGRKIVVAAVQGDPVQTPGADAAGAAAAKQSALRDQALADAGVQAMLEVFPAEIRDVEEM
jgi:hypothetical protein